MSALPLLSRRYLLDGGVRSVLTFISVLLASALVFGSGSIMESVRAQLVKSAIETHGSYHIAYSGLSSSQAALLGAQVEVESWGYRYREEVKLPGTDLVLDLSRLGGGAAELLGVERWITLGEFPVGQEELLIGARTAASLGRAGLLEIESTPGGYRISGLYTESLYRSFLPARPAWGLAKPLAELTENREERLTLYLRLSSPADIPRFIASVSGRTGLELPPVIRNETLLSLYGYGSDSDLSSAMRGFTLLIVIVILVAAAAVVYNTFSVSAAERIREYGMLQAVGASPGQIRNLVLREVLLIGGAAIPAGFLTGFLGIRLLFRVADRISDNVVFENIRAVVSAPTIILSAATVAGTLLFSALLPAVRAGRRSPMDGVRTGTAAPLKGAPFLFFPRFSSRLGRGKQVVLFLSLRGMRRHGLRSVGTLISIAVPVILFVAFGGMLKLSREANLLQESRLPGIVYSRNGGVPAELPELLKRHPDSGAVYPVRRLSTFFSLPEVALTPAYRTYAGDGIERMPGSVLVQLNECRILSYGEDLFEELKLEEGVWLVAESEFIDRDGVKRYLKPTLLGPGDGILVGKEMRSLTISGVLASPPFKEYNPTPGGLDLVVGDELYRSLSGDDGGPETLLVRPEAGRRQSLVDLLERVRAAEGGELIDAQQLADGMHRDYLAVALFFYGFIGMVLAIGGLNIVSSVRANLILRRGEFGLLAAAGMEPAQIRRLILWEVLLLAAGAVIVGTAAGCALWSTLWHILGSVRGSNFFLPLGQILIALVAVPALVLLSVRKEAIKVSRRPIVEQLRA